MKLSFYICHLFQMGTQIKVLPDVFKKCSSTNKLVLRAIEARQWSIIFG